MSEFSGSFLTLSLPLSEFYLLTLIYWYPNFITPPKFGHHKWIPTIQKISDKGGGGSQERAKLSDVIKGRHLILNASSVFLKFPAHMGTYSELRVYWVKKKWSTQLLRPLEYDGLTILTNWFFQFHLMNFVVIFKMSLNIPLILEGPLAYFTLIRKNSSRHIFSDNFCWRRIIISLCVLLLTVGAPLITTVSNQKLYFEL